MNFCLCFAWTPSLTACATRGTSDNSLLKAHLSSHPDRLIEYTHPLLSSSGVRGRTHVQLLLLAVEDRDVRGNAFKCVCFKFPFMLIATRRLVIRNPLNPVPCATFHTKEIRQTPCSIIILFAFMLIPDACFSP
jgi:hypothetical protein